MRPGHRYFPVGAFACDFEGTVLRVQARMPSRTKAARLYRIAVEVLPALPVPKSTSGRTSLELRRSPPVAILFDTDQQMVPSRIWVGEDAPEVVGIASLTPTADKLGGSIRHRQWNREIYASTNDLVVADYELYRPFPSGTTAAAVFVFEVPE